MNAEIISVGTELTFGLTVDTNSAWLSRRLAEVGIVVCAHHTVPDDLAVIRDAIDQAAGRADVVLVTGGLGPTEDDLTRQALAEAMGAPLVLHEAFVEHIREFFRRRGRDMPERNKVQAMFPAGARPIANTCGTAPGIHAELHGAAVFVMPGVPAEMKTMFERDILAVLDELRTARQQADGVILTLTLRCYGTGESNIAEQIRDLMQPGRNPAVGTTAEETIIAVRIHARGSTRQQAQRMLDETAAEIRERLGELVFGQDDETLAHAAAKLLFETGKTVAVAESCTGGLIAKSLTDIPGSSRYFLEGIVAYSNQAKVRLLGVPAEAIARHGAVSEQVARAMAVGARQRSGSDLAIAATGIAGPEGGSAEKPVGLVYIALADPHGCSAEPFRFGEHLARQAIRDRARKAALNALRLRLLGG